MQTLRFVTGPFRASVDDTRDEWLPLAGYLGKCLGVTADLTIKEDWGSVGQSMERGEYDVAWMGGGARYVIARANGAGPAIATVHFAGSPVYRSIVVTGKNSHLRRFPEDAQGMSISFTHESSTTGWLVPYAFLVSRGIDPETYFQYSGNLQHADNLVGVASGKFDLATDHDNNRRAMIARGVVSEDDVRVVWQSDPVPQDPISVRADMDERTMAGLQSALVDAAAKGVPLPRGYTGFTAASDATYDGIREAAVATGRIRRTDVR